jgi:hypothetical protein
MAKRKSTREAHSSRSRSSHRSRPRPGDRALEFTPSAQPVAATPRVAIEGARTQLMRARAVLDCTRFVLLYDDQVEGEQRPSFSDAIDVARDLVDAVIDALDPVNLRPGKKPALPSAHSDIDNPDHM